MHCTDLAHYTAAASVIIWAQRQATAMYKEVSSRNRVPQVPLTYPHTTRIDELNTAWYTSSRSLNVVRYYIRGIWLFQIISLLLKSQHST